MDEDALYAKVDEAMRFYAELEKVATVSSKGKNKAVKAGTATITVKAGKYKAKCKVTVK